jgi:hypothetical protein
LPTTNRQTPDNRRVSAKACEGMRSRAWASAPGTMQVMDPTCPRCGSDAAVTRTTEPDGIRYTCRFSHSGEGPFSWMVRTRSRSARAPVAAGSGGARTPRKPAAPRATRPSAQSRTDAPARVASARLTVNERGIAAVVEEVTRRGGHARVEQDGNKREVVVTGDGDSDSDGKGDSDGGAVRLVVRARTAGAWQTKASYGEPRAEEEHPTTFWVLVHLASGRAFCYVVPEWWIQNDISEKHDDYLRSRGGTRQVNPDSDHHAIGTDRVAQWLDRWDQLPMLKTL